MQSVKLKDGSYIDAESVWDATREKTISEAVSDVDGKFDTRAVYSVNQKQISDTTLLNAVLATGTPFGSLGIINATDTPDTGEWTIVWFGSQLRITVLAARYTKTQVYMRHIFGNAWQSEWTQIN